MPELICLWGTWFSIGWSSGIFAYLTMKETRFFAPQIMDLAIGLTGSALVGLVFQFVVNRKTTNTFAISVLVAFITSVLLLGVVHFLFKKKEPSL